MALLLPAVVAAQDRSALQAERATLVAVATQEGRLRDSLTALIATRTARIRVIDSLLALPAPVAVLAVSPTTVNLVIGQSSQLIAVAKDADGNVLTGRVVSWVSSNPGSAMVSSTGVVSALAAGTATVTATSEGKTSTAAVVISAPVPAPVATITVSPTGATLAPGQTQQFTATTRDAAGNILSGRVTTWSISAPSIASISSTGLVTALVAGTATVTATSEGKSAGAAVNINAPAPVPAPSLLFLADAETGNPSQWCYVHSAVPVGVVTSPVRDGLFSFKVEVRDGVTIFGTERSEYSNGPDDCAHHRYKLGEENYTAVSVFLPTTWPSYSHWALVMQFKGPHTGTPPLQLSLRNNEWGIYGNGRISPRPYWRIAPIQRGAWNDFVIRVKWSPDPTVGFFEVYYQGVVVIPKTFASTMYLDAGVATPLFLSVGYYRDSAGNTTALLYIDAVRVGNSLAAVTPK